MSSARRQRSLVEDLENSAGGDRWLVSYSDFVTLLFAFFVVMYASSSINEDKYQVLSEALEVVFQESPRALDPVQVGEPMLSATVDLVDVSGTSAHGHPDAGDTTILPEAEVLAERFAGFSADDRLQIEANNDWIELSVGSSLGFDRGSANLNAQGRQIVTTVADYVGGMSLPVHIEGYTDNVPSRSRLYPSNWALASARAAAVAAAFQTAGIDRRRLSVTGYADNHALRTNATPDGRVANRRVVIVIARKTGLARDLNALPGSSAFAKVRQSEAPVLDERIKQQRRGDGSLLFSN